METFTACDTSNPNRGSITSFNFLASLINGNAYAILKSIMPIRPFNFLASLINGNVGVVAAAYKQ